MTQPITTNTIDAQLAESVASLQQVIHEITAIRMALQLRGEHPEALSATVWQAIRTDLIDLGTPLHYGSILLYQAFQAIAEKLGGATQEPDYLRWLTGVDWKQSHLAREQERGEQLAAIHQWLDPYLERVSPHTRTVVLLALARDGVLGIGAAPLSTLTEAYFVAQLQRSGGGYVGVIRGLGATRLAELRAAFGVAPSTPNE